jgi:cell division protein FtsW
LGGARLWQFVLLVSMIAVVFGFLAISSPYRLVRLTTFLHPWADQFNNGYQLTQSLIAFGRGGIFGVGLGNSIQKLFYLPEAHTDFLFAVLAEELGIIGELVVIGLFTGLVAKILSIGRLADKIDNKYAAFIAYGFSFWFGLQTMINIGVNTGILPTKGLTLPFMSYGGSSILLNCVAIAILLRIYHECNT